MQFLNVVNMYYILTIAEEGNITKAAEKVHTTQPNLTRIIQKEENRIGLQIFDKEKIPWRLTYAGQIYIKTAKEILRINNEFSEQTKSIISEQKGLLKLGVMAFEERYLLPKLLPIIKNECPDIEIEKVVAVPFEVDSLLYKNMVNFAIVVTDDHIDIEYIPLKSYDIVLALPINHPLAENYNFEKNKDNFPEIDIRLLEKEPFIAMEGGILVNYIRNLVYKDFGFKLNIEQLVHSSDVAMANVEAGYNYVAFILDVVAYDRYDLKRAAFFKVKGKDYKQDTSIAYLKSRNLNKLEKKFLEIIKNTSL